ncbi:MAG: ABC transporter substrate-binding protein [Roseburia sp.]
MKKRLLSLMLVLTTSVSLCACGGNSGAGTDTNTNTDTNAGTEAAGAEEVQSEGTEAAEGGSQDVSDLSYDEQSAIIYQEALGEFYDAYMTAKEAETVSERYALMAVAEAKLMESAVMLPVNSHGGSYAISRVVPYTAPNVLWGNDYERYHSILVCTEPLKSEDRIAMKEKYAEEKGKGTYIEWAKSFLEEKGYTLKDTYSLAYPSDPTTWDVLATSRSADSEAIINTYDGLMEYDYDGILQPALAESYTVSDDGLTYTFKLREGVEWVDSQGRKVADVVADDFVAGLQHMMDAQGGLEYLVQGIILNASQYISGEVTDFSQVGVKAVDDYTVEYTLEAPCSYFVTMLGYGVFAPMSRTYFTSQGGAFGLAEYADASASDSYTYGKNSDSIAYCGPYLVTNSTEKNTIVFKANDSYWNKDNVTIKTLTWLFDDGSDVTRLYNDMKSGTLDGAALNTSTITMAKDDGWFDQYAYTSSTDATSFMGFYNLNRVAFANTNDTSTVVSTQTEEDAARTNAAMRNVHFRRALSFATDRGAMQAQVKGEDLKYASMRNTYTPGTFVTLEEDTTIDINGTATTFPAGTYYGEIMQAQIDADGVAIKAWDPAADDGIGSSDGYDGWYNADNAVAELNTAIEELAAAGVTVDESNPILVDYPYPSVDERYTNKANAYKQSVEAALGGKVIINLVDTTDYDGWYYAGYYTSYGYEANYDMYDLSGWGPDYGDPSTYLDTFLPDYAGYMIKCIGLY